MTSNEQIPDRVRLPVGARIGGISVSFLRVNDAKELLARSLDIPSFTLVSENNSYTISGRSLGISYDMDTALASAYTNRNVSAVSLTADETVLRARLHQFALQAQVAPTDAAVTVDGKSASLFTYREDRAGAAIDESALADAIYEAMQNGETTITLPTTPIEAAVTLADVQRMTQPLSSFTTSFADSPLNKEGRVFNIQKAAAAIHGTVLLPGEEFDCNAVLGDRNEKNGWREAAAIRSGMYTTEYGGGVCQVSSTLFNAVMMADLPITERYPHSWPMRYVSIGRDATISTGGKNFRFVNEHDTPITIGMTVDRKKMQLTCTIYGTPLPAGQYIRIRSEQTDTLDTLPAEWVLDESLPYATSITEREARQGKTSVTYKDFYTANGTLLRSEVAYRDTYRSIAARILVSTDLYYAQSVMP